MVKAKATQKDLHYFINNYYFEHGVDMFIDYVKNKSKCSKLENYVNLYGYKDGVEYYIKEKEYLKNNNGIIASKESLLVFDKSMKYLDDNNLKYFVGSYNNKEYRIDKGKKKYYYDFTIPELNLIVEYNGSHVHADIELDEKTKKEWKHAYLNISFDDMIKIDSIKNKIAMDEGFDVIYLWDYKQHLSTLIFYII